MKKTYIAPEMKEIMIEDVITVSVLKTEPNGDGLEINFDDLLPQ